MSTFPSLSPFITAGLAWAAVLWLAPRYLRHRRDIRWSVFWQTVLLLALALTVVLPPVYLAVDRFLGLPNAARWISNACVLVGAYLVDTFFWTLAHGPERLRWHRRWLLVSLLLTIAAMAVALWRADIRTEVLVLDSPRLQPALVAYRLVYLAFLGFVLVRLIAFATQYARRTPDPVVQVGMILSVAGGVAGMGYVGFTLAQVLTPASSPLAPLLLQGVTLSLLGSVICVVLSATAPQWGRHMRVAALVHHLQVVRAYRRLGFLWRRLSQAQPYVVLPTAISKRSARMHAHEMEFLLQRRVIEILDARRLLLANTTSQPQHASASWRAGNANGRAPAVPDAGMSDIRDMAIAPWPAGDTDNLRLALDGTIVPGTASWTGATPHDEALERLAQAEAWLLHCHLNRTSHAASGPQPVVELHQPATFEEAIHYLERVTVALRGYRRRRRGGGPRRRTTRDVERRDEVGQRSPA